MNVSRIADNTYQLVRKITSQNVPADLDFYVPKTAVKFDEVEVAKDGLTKKIVTFFDGNETIVQRNVLENDRITTHKVYKTYVKESGLTNRQVETYKNRNGNLEKVGTMTQNVDKSSDKIHVTTLYNSSQISDGGKIKWQCEQRDAQGRRINAEFTDDGNGLVTTDSVALRNVDPVTVNPFGDDINTLDGLKSDEFLFYRMLPGEQKTVALTKHFLRKEGLQDLDIAVIPNSDKMKNSPNLGVFWPSSGIIEFQNIPSIDTMAHEAAHAKQYGLIGRLKRNTWFTPYQEEVQNSLGGKKKMSKEEIRQAKKYVKADREYPTPTQRSKNNDLYQFNILEVDANKAGQEAQKLYNKSGVAFNNFFDECTPSLDSYLVPLHEL